MLLSKQEFSKLSRKDQLMLSKVRPQQKKKSKISPPQNKQNQIKSRQNNRLGQASVAAAYSTPSMGRAPIVKATRDSCNIKHKEFIGNVTGSVLFAVANAFAVNPGLAATFPWLSIMAQGWEEYRFRNLRFVYKTRTGSTTPGSVLMAPDYDSADVPPASEQIMTSYAQVIEDAPWKDIICVLKTSNENPLGKRHFVRTAALAANLDIKTYDIANFFVGTVDGTAVPWGKLWVEYDVDFFIPQLPPVGLAGLVGGRIIGGGVESAANPLGTIPALDPDSVGLAVNALSVVTLSSPGTYLVTGSMTGTVMSGVTMTPSAGIVGSGLGFTFNAAATVGQFQETFVAANPGTIAFTATATTITNMTVILSVAPANSVS
jgi:hypothetical protein